MKFKTLFLTLSLITLTPASHALDTKSVKAFLSKAKSNKAVQGTATGLQVLFYGTLTGLLMASGYNNIEYATRLPAGEQHYKDTPGYIKSFSRDSLLPSAAALLYFAAQSFTGNLSADIKTADSTETQSEESEQAPAAC